jgi:hypothetical protein
MQSVYEIRWRGFSVAGSVSECGCTILAEPKVNDG